MANGNHDSSVLRRDLGFDTDEDEDARFCWTCVWKFEAGGGSTRSSSSSMGRRVLNLVLRLGLGGGGDSTNDDMDVVVWGCSGASLSSSTSASPPVSSSRFSSSSSLMLMKFRWRALLGTRPGARERPSRHASALERSTLRLRTVREEVTVLTGEKDMKDSCRARRKLGDESGDTGDGVGNPWLDVRDGERPLTGGAERGGWCDVGEPRLEEDVAGGKREKFGIKMGGGARESLRCDGRLGRAEEGAGLGDGRVRRESREGRRAMMDCGAERDDDGTGWSLRLP